WTYAGVIVLPGTGPGTSLAVVGMGTCTPSDDGAAASSGIAAPSARPRTAVMSFDFMFLLSRLLLTAKILLRCLGNVLALKLGALFMIRSGQGSGQLTLALTCRRKPQRRRSGATVLIVKGAFVYFFSSAPPGVARASDASAWR